VRSATLSGIEAATVFVEVDVTPGLPSFTNVGSTLPYCPDSPSTDLDPPVNLPLHKPPHSCGDARRSLTLSVVPPAWKSVLIGIASGGLLVYVVRPVLDRMPSALLNLVEMVSQRWTDLVFSEAASRPNLEGFFLSAVALMFVVAALWTIKLRLPYFGDVSSLLPGMLLGFALGLFLIGSLRGSSAYLEDCFHAHIAVLSPHLSDLEIKTLVASWTTMHSRADYDAILRRLILYETEYKVAPIPPRCRSG
jgi:hypothetical protein